MSPQAAEHTKQKVRPQATNGSSAPRSAKESHERRLAANRRSARKSRYRNKVLLDELRESVNEMKDRNESIRRQNEEIRRELAKYARIHGDGMGGVVDVSTSQAQTLSISDCSNDQPRWVTSCQTNDQNTPQTMVHPNLLGMAYPHLVTNTSQQRGPFDVPIHENNPHAGLGSEMSQQTEIFSSISNGDASNTSLNLLPVSENIRDILAGCPAAIQGFDRNDSLPSSEGGSFG